jgi:hypothetical protein
MEKNNKGFRVQIQTIRIKRIPSHRIQLKPNPSVQRWRTTNFGSNLTATLLWPTLHTQQQFPVLYLISGRFKKTIGFIFIFPIRISPILMLKMVSWRPGNKTIIGILKYQSCFVKSIKKFIEFFVFCYFFIYSNYNL